MFLRNKRLGIGVVLGPILWANSALAGAQPWQVGFQPAASTVMQRIEEFNTLLLFIITSICLVVFVLLSWIVIRYNHRRNPNPSKTSHNTVLEVAWTIIPVMILVVIAIPSFRLLYFEADIPTPDVTIRAIGKQWFWTYEYTGKANFQFDSLGLSDDAARRAGEPRMLGVDNVVVVPVNKVVQVDTLAADVIHSWAIPAFGVKMDAIPGHINHAWFKAIKTGTYYGECSELCGARHAFMPIEVKVVTDVEYAAWRELAKRKYAAIDYRGASPHVATK